MMIHFYVKYLGDSNHNNDTIIASEWTIESSSAVFYRYNKFNARYISHVVNLRAVRAIERGPAVAAEIDEKLRDK